VHGRRLERNEQLVATGVKLGPGDELYDLCGITEAIQAERVHLANRLQQIATKTGYDPRTFAGLVDLICMLETTDNDRQP
jgi:hypothetical protein